MRWDRPVSWSESSDVLLDDLHYNDSGWNDLHYNDSGWNDLHYNDCDV
jgi:hypothetical protein